FVISLLRGVVVLAQLSGARELGLGELELGLGLGLLRLGRLEGKLEGTRLDDEEEVAFLDQLPVGEIDRLEIATDARADLYRLTRLDLAGEIGPFLNIPDQGLGHRDGRRRRSGRTSLFPLPKGPIAIKESGGGNDKQQQEQALGHAARARLLFGSGAFGLDCRLLDWLSRRLGPLERDGLVRDLGPGVFFVRLAPPVPVSPLNHGRISCEHFSVICGSMSLVASPANKRRYPKGGLQREPHPWGRDQGLVKIAARKKMVE